MGYTLVIEQQRLVYPSKTGHFTRITSSRPLKTSQVTRKWPRTWKFVSSERA